MIINYKIFETQINDHEDTITGRHDPEIGFYVNCKGGEDGWFTYIAPEFNTIIHNSIGKIIDYKEHNDIFIVSYDNIPAKVFGKYKTGVTTFKIYIDEITYWSKDLDEVKNKMIEERFDL